MKKMYCKYTVIPANEPPIVQDESGFIGQVVL